MNKTDMINHIAATANLSKADAGRALDAFVGGVGEALKQGDTVQMVGFGTFSVSKRAARVGRNPRTGTEIKIAARNTPVFKAGQGLKNLVG